MATTNPTPSFDLLMSLQVLTCTTCGAPFAVATVLHRTQAAQNGSVMCPAGHSVAVGAGDIPQDNLLLSDVALRQQLQQARHEADALRRELAVCKPASGNEPLTNKELRRRSGILAARAEPLHYGRKLCCFCGQEKGGGRLASHMRRQHRKELEEMPSSAFE